MTEDLGSERYCPSAEPGEPGAVVLGLVAGPARPVTYLDAPVPVTAELLGGLGDVPPGRVLRIAAPCMQGECRHWGEGSGCGLVTKIARALPEVAADGPLPRCHLRARCRWCEQEKAAACRRCPLVLTSTDETELSRRVADPGVTADEFDPRDLPDLAGGSGVRPRPGPRPGPR